MEIVKFKAGIEEREEMFIRSSNPPYASRELSYEKRLEEKLGR